MSDKRYPAAMENGLKALTANNTDREKAVRSILEEARKLLKKDPDLAMSTVRQAGGKVDSMQAIVRNFRAGLDSFDQARSSYGEKMQKAQKSFDGVKAYLTDLKEKGYFVDPNKELMAARQEIEAAQSMLSTKNDVPDYQAVIRRAGNSESKATAVKDNWASRLRMRARNNDSLDELSLWFDVSFPQLKTSWENAFKALKEKAPQEVWEPLTKEMGRNEAMIEASYGKLSRAVKLFNGMEEQKFEDAAEATRRLNALKADLESSLAEPAKILREFAEAQSKKERLSSQVAQAISQAESALKNSDAKGAGSDKLKEAKEKLASAKKLEESNLPNWLLVTGLLAGAVALAQTAKSEADRKVAAVKAQRRREEEEEEEERSSYGRSYSSGSSWSSGSSISSHSSGFGGFGGGSFGGGGASGRF